MCRNKQKMKSRSEGIASITTMAVALFAILIFAVRAAQGLMPWIDVWYGVGAEILLIWALDRISRNYLKAMSAS